MITKETLADDYRNVLMKHEKDLGIRLMFNDLFREAFALEHLEDTHLAIHMIIRKYEELPIDSKGERGVALELFNAYFEDLVELMPPSFKYGIRIAKLCVLGEELKKAHFNKEKAPLMRQIDKILDSMLEGKS